MNLRRVVIKRIGGRWELLREHETGGDRFVCDDLHDAFDCVLDAYRPDGTPRSVTTQAAAGGGSSSSSKAG